MKKLFFFIAGLVLITGCSSEDDSVIFNYDVVPIVNVNLPDTLVFGAEYNFPIQYYRPTNCYVFEGFDYSKEDSTRYVAVINRVYDTGNCNTLSEDNDESFIEEDFAFKVLYDYTYTFKFFQGMNSSEEAQYLVIKVPVKRS